MYGQYLPYNYNYYGWQPQVLENDNYFRETQGPIAGDFNDPNVAAFYGVTTGGSPDMDHNTRSLRLTLNRITLENVDDAAGRWQIEGGQMLRGNRPVGNYASTKRIVNQGTSPQNTAMLTLTLFFIDPSDNITLQGSHDFNSGDQIGSVSAATSSFSYYIGHQFRVSGNSLVIQ